MVRFNFWIRFVRSLKREFNCEIYHIPDMSYFSPDCVIFRTFIAVPILATSINLAAVGTLDDVSRPGILCQTIPRVCVLCLRAAGHNDLVTITVTFFADVNQIFKLVLVPTSEKKSNLQYFSFSKKKKKKYKLENKQSVILNTCYYCNEVCPRVNAPYYSGSDQNNSNTWQDKWSTDPETKCSKHFQSPHWIYHSEFSECYKRGVVF